MQLSYTCKLFNIYICNKNNTYYETHMIDQNTNTYEYNSLSTERSELDEVNHVWFLCFSGDL